ncbi:MAG: hypothetical protein J6K33_02270 [Alistipes sp.]|nr:hypothetical protein [Rikenellaceae bacterium]MBP3496639.1 hypothetical protein [Alistipes sp.]
MKKMIYVVLFALMAIFAQDVNAQSKSEVSKEEAKVKSEALMNTRLEMIKDELQLTDAQFAAFDPVYREYRKAVGRVSDKGARVKKEDLTDENVLKVMSIRLSNTINTASVKQKYLWIFAEIIEPMQIEKLYRIDDRIAREARKIVQYK